jgi:hypothetical protein
MVSQILPPPRTEPARLPPPPRLVRRADGGVVVIVECQEPEEPARLTVQQVLDGRVVVTPARPSTVVVPVPSPGRPCMRPGLKAR